MAEARKDLYCTADRQYPYELKAVGNELQQTEDDRNKNQSRITATGIIRATGHSFSSGNDQTLNLFWQDDNEHKNRILIGQQLFKGMSLYQTISTNATITVKHKEDGTLNGKVVAQFIRNTTSAYAPENGEIGASFTLTPVPRYAKITGYNLANAKATQFGVQWSADKAIDQVQYNVNGTGWKVAPGSGTSGNFNITGLRPNTAYSVIISVRAKDSQLWTNSSAKTINTSKAIMYLGTRRVKAYYGKGGRWREAVPYYGKNGKWRAGK